MLRTSRILKQHMSSAGFTFQRTYHYQTEIYNNEFTESKRLNDPLYENLRKENENLYEIAKQEPNLYRFIKAYRQYGFKIGDINPLKSEKVHNMPLELDPIRYGLDRSSQYSTNGLLSGGGFKSLNEIESYLKDIYSKNITIEFDHILNEEEKLWISKEFEAVSNQQLDSKVKVNVLKLLLKSQAFDQFLAKRFPSFKRYSLEGGESAMAFYQSLFSSSAASMFYY
jgi:probable 2-oxoglutarate dehydrogenase E1 component DHKTD1